MEEVAILNTLDHPNIVKYYETYDDNKYIYLVMEYISGVQLFTKITNTASPSFNQLVGMSMGYLICEPGKSYTVKPFIKISGKLKVGGFESY